MSSSETFQHYQVLKKPDGALWELGRGAMGVTYKAFDTNLRCNVALKVINSNYLDSEMAGQRFLREARAAAGLSHPNVASVFHLGEEGGNYFYAMEYINGETVEALVKRRGPLPPGIAMRITLQVARALRAAARVGLVHRDIKPANLMLVREDEEDTDDNELHLKVIDFGLAKVTRKEGADVSATITVAGFVGTPHFASPEQLEEKDLDARSDIYSLGITLWYMLAGKPPFSGSMVQIMSQHLTRRPAFENLKDVGAPVLKVLERMLEKDPANRQQTPSELRREIETAVHELDGTSPSTPGGPAPDGSPMPTEIMTTSASALPGHVTARAPEPGVVLDGRYRLTRRVSQSERGVLFEAVELDSGRIVAVEILSPELLSDAATFQKAQEDFTRLSAVNDPAFTGLFAFVRTAASTFVAYEWINGFSLVDVLRQRPVLTAADALRVLKPVAGAVDHLKNLGVSQPEIDSARVVLALPGGAQAAGQTGLLTQAFAAWPAFQPKIFPLRLSPQAGSSATWAGQQTIVPVQATAPTGAALVGLLAYDILGGNAAQFQSSHRYTPLPTVSEAANTILRDVLLNSEGSPRGTASEFIDAFAAGTQGSGANVEPSSRSKTPSVPGETPPPVEPPASGAGTVPPPVKAVPVKNLPPAMPSVPPLTVPPPRPAPPSVVSQPKGVPVLALLLGTFAVTLVLGALTYAGMKLIKGRLADNGGTVPTPALETPLPRYTPDPSTPRPTPTSTPIVQYTPPPTPPPTPRAPPATPPPTPRGTPDRVSRLAALLAEAKQMQDNRQTADAFAAYVRIAEEFPESDEGLGRIDSYISDLRGAPLSDDLEKRRFQGLRPSVERAAKLGSDMAMLFLADHLLGTETTAAAEWYQAAAEKGRPEAMLAVGDLCFKGLAGVGDPSQAARWYQLASDKGYVKAKINLAECYEMGKGGVQRDFDRSYGLLSEANNLDPANARALEKLAIASELGHGTPVNFKQAFSLMKRSSEAGNTNALANLGAYYMKGLGTPRNERQAAALFKEGAEKNSPACMFFYAQCLEAGLGGMTANKAEAQGYYRGSAERNFPPAKDYCKRNGITYTPKN